MDDRSPGCRRMFVGTLIVTVVMFSCIIVSIVGIDGLCVADVGPRLPFYNGATITSERYTMFRRFGMGETVIILYSPDDYQTVTGWYGRTVGAKIKENLDKGLRQFGSTRWTVGRAEDGTGSQIILYSRCGA
jgi:hypothetical protein